MSKPSVVNTIFDAAAAVTLRNVTDGAETATATEAGVSLSELDTAYWHNGEIPHGVFEVAVHITALDTGNADETYVLSLLVDDTSDMSNTPATIATYTVTSAGFVKMLVDSKSLAELDAESSGADKWLAIKATLAGTTPSITYGAWIGKSLTA